MKKKLLFFVMVSAVMAMSYAQGPELAGTLGLDSYTHQSSRGIIREQGISYYEFLNQGYFVYLSSLSGVVNQVKTPMGWYIRDFRVMGDKAYFCGVDSMTNTALLGHFELGNLHTGFGNINFVRDNGISTQLSILNRIAVSMNKDTVTVMAIGRKGRGFNPEMYGADRVVYLANYSSMQGSIFAPSSSTELFWDVVSTDEYFVTAGTDKLITSVLTMRKVPIGTGLPAFGTIFSNGYSYPCTEIFESGVRATNLNNDSIVMAAYIDRDFESRTMMALYTIDVPTAQMAYRQEHYTYISYTGSRMLPPREMVYLRDSTALIVIDTNSFTNNHTHILRLTPYVTPAVLIPWIYLYISSYYLHPQCKVEYNSLIATSGSSCMAAAGANWLKLDFQDLVPPPGYHNHCIYNYYDVDCFNRAVFPESAFWGGSCIDYIRPVTVDLNPVQLEDIDPCLWESELPFTSNELIDIK